MINYKDLSSPMFVRSEILLFPLHYYRSITTTVTAAGRYDDTFGYRALFYDLLYVEAEDLDLSCPAACCCCWPGIPRCVFQRFSAILTTRQGEEPCCCSSTTSLPLLLLLVPLLQIPGGLAAADNFWWIREARSSSFGSS